MSLLNLKLSLLSATELAAISANEWIGRNNKIMADQSAVTAMRNALNNINFQGTIKIGEGERDKAPMLAIGEIVGKKDQNSNIKLDIALDPLEGTTICARGEKGAMSVLAVANENCILHAPDVYMSKLVTDSSIDTNSVSIEYPIEDNLYSIAQQKQKKIEELNIIILDRPRHQEMINRIRALNARVTLIRDGDIAASIAVVLGNADLYVGIGGAPEGVLSAGIIKCLSGNIQGKLIFENNESIKRAESMGIGQINKIYNAQDMIKGDVMFVATAITDVLDMQGIYSTDEYIVVDSLIACTTDKSVTRIKNTYYKHK